MAYTPINWQTGDTITADKLNRCDNGWGVESTQLFSETVTTEDDGDGNYAALAYDGNIDADTITVTLDGTEYVCSRIDAFGRYFYGGFNQGPDFTTYPFFIASGGGNYVYTETAGEHTIAVLGSAIVTSSDFASAVSEAVQPLIATSGPFPVVIGTTTFSETLTALRSQGRLGYVVATTFYNDQPSWFEPILSITQSSRTIQTLGIISGELTIRTYTASSNSGPFVLNS